MSIVSDTQPRSTYVHIDGCRAVSTVGLEIARALADDSGDYDDLYCSGCRDRRPIEEFAWVGSDGVSDDRIRTEEE